LVESGVGPGEARDRLLREVRALILSRHPNMEMLEGRTLEGVITARRQLAIADTVHIGRQLCDALAFVHRWGIVHRDVKPSNVFLARDDAGNEVVKLLDFGIAHLGGEAAREADRKLTQDNAVLGTPEYMAPEQLMMTGQTDARVDIYSLGATLYECLTGAVPFEGNYAQVLLKVATEPLPPIRAQRADVPIPLATAIERALAKDPAARPPDVLSLERALVDATGLDRGLSELLGVGARLAASVLPGVAASPPRPSRPDGKRRFGRAPYVTPVRITTGDGVIDSRSEDISEGGLLVFTVERFQDGATVRVDFALPNSGHIVTIDAVAKWVRRGRAAGTAGLEFVSAPPHVRSAIADYVASMGVQS
jgi:serine/threonine protein kinase